MLNKIKNSFEAALKAYSRTFAGRLAKQPFPVLINEAITNFIGRPGKRIRPILFLLSYLGSCSKPKTGIYTSAVGLELLHDFLLIHDDIIDRTVLRKGQPTMHRLLEHKLARYKKLKFNGTDLAIVIGDILYALALEAFAANREAPERKLTALGTLLKTTALTGYGEAVELLAETRDLSTWKESDVYEVYDLKTGNYTFCAPLICGAQLAGATAGQINALQRYGILLGRAFQIKDDLLDIFATQKQIGKTPLTDLREGKKTLLIRQAYCKASASQRRFLRTALAGERISEKDCLKIRELIVATGARDYARASMASCRSRAQRIAAGQLALRPAARRALHALTAEILSD